MTFLNIMLKTILKMAHSLFYSFSGIILGLNTLVRGFFIFGVVALFLSGLMGHPPKYSDYIVSIVIILISTFIDVLYKNILNGVGDWLYDVDDNPSKKTFKKELKHD